MVSLCFLSLRSSGVFPRTAGIAAGSGLHSPEFHLRGTTGTQLSSSSLVPATGSEMDWRWLGVFVAGFDGILEGFQDFSRVFVADTERIRSKMFFFGGFEMSSKSFGFF